MSVEIGGRVTPGTDHDLITHNGAPGTLNGQLVVSLINGFTFQDGDALPVMTFNPGGGLAAPLSKFPSGVTLPDTTGTGLVFDTLWTNNVADVPDTLRRIR